MKIHIVNVPRYEIRLYLGSRFEPEGRSFDEAELLFVIAQYQIDKGLVAADPVRVTPTTYVWQDYSEPGWELGIFSYPRTGKTTDVLRAFAVDLGAHLLEHFRQNRICVVFPQEVVMLEADKPEIE